MNETVTIPKAEYERLCALEEELADVQAALAIEAKIASGEEELIPAEVVDRLLAGEAPLRVWRELHFPGWEDVYEPRRPCACGASSASLPRLRSLRRPASTACRSSRLRRAAAPGPSRRFLSWPPRFQLMWMTSFRSRHNRPGDRRIIAIARARPRERAACHPHVLGRVDFP